MPNLRPVTPPASTRWQPGKSGNPFGRPRSLLRRVDDVLHAEGKEPIKEILALLPKVSAQMQVKIWLDLLPYVCAKPKEMALSEEEEERERIRTMPHDELMSLVKQHLREIGEIE